MLLLITLKYLFKHNKMTTVGTVCVFAYVVELTDESMLVS